MVHVSQIYISFNLLMFCIDSNIQKYFYRLRDHQSMYLFKVHLKSADFSFI